MSIRNTHDYNTLQGEGYISPETQVMRCFSEGWFQEKVFGRVDLNVSNDGVDYALAFRKTLVF